MQTRALYNSKLREKKEISALRLYVRTLTAVPKLAKPPEFGHRVLGAGILGMERDMETTNEPRGMHLPVLSVPPCKE